MINIYFTATNKFSQSQSKHERTRLAMNRVPFLVSHFRRLLPLFFFDIAIILLISWTSPIIALVSSFSTIILISILISMQGFIYFIILTAPIISILNFIYPEVNLLRIIFTGILMLVFWGRLHLEDYKIELLPKNLMIPVFAFLGYFYMNMFFSINPLKAAWGIMHLIYYLLVAITIYNTFGEYHKWNRLIV